VTTRKPRPTEDEEPEQDCHIPGCRLGPRVHPRHPRDPVYDPESMTVRELEEAGIRHLGGGWWQDGDGVFNSDPHPGPPPR